MRDPLLVPANQFNFLTMPHALRAQYTLCVVGSAALAYWLPGWYKLIAVPFAFWGLAGFNLLPVVDITPIVAMVSCAGPTLKVIGGML